MILLYGQPHPVLLKPVVGIALREAFHQALLEPMPARIDLLQIPDVLEGVRTVTAPATADGHLPQHALAALQDGHLSLRPLRFHRECQKESCGSSAYDCYLHCPPSLSK